MAWQQVSNKNFKRKSDYSPEESNAKIRTLTPTSQSIDIHNRYDILSQNVENNTTTNEETPKTPKPPPIFLPGINDVKPLIEIIKESIQENYFLKAIGNSQVKLQVNDIQSYRKIVKTLKDKEVMFHTYQLKEQRSYRVVIRNLHHSTDINELTKEIENNGHKVINIHNIKEKFTKKPLPLFYIEIAQNINNKDIYNIKHLQHTIVQVEPPHPKKEIPQCARCQCYGHTKAYCTKQPRCVKCGQNHLTKDCKKESTTEATYALCEGKHPANYKGCIVYKEIQQRKFPSMRERHPIQKEHPATQQQQQYVTIQQHEPPPTQQEQKSTQSQNYMPTQTTNTDKTYAYVTKNNKADNNETNPQTHHSNQNQLEQMVQKLMEKMDTMLNLLTILVSKMK